MSPLVLADTFQQFSAINLLLDPGHVGGPVVIPNGFRVSLVFTLTDGKTARIITGAQVPAGFNATPAIAEAIRASMASGATWTALAAFLATTTSLARVELLDLRTAQLAPVASTGAATAGTSASPALPDEVAYAITLRTARTGPSGRGRCYVPGWATNALGSNGLIASAASTAARNWIANIGTAFTGQGIVWALALPHRQQYTGKTGTVHPDRPARMEPITNAIARDLTWDSQRRRGLK